MFRQSRQPGLPAFLLTRPAAQSARFADEVRQRFGDDFQIVIAPLMLPRFLSPPLPEPLPGTLIFTSETGVEGFRRLCARADLAAWCVGSRTAARARAAGFAARDGGGDAAALVAAIIASGESGPLLYVRGEDQATDVAAALSLAGAETSDLIVYRQVPIPLSRSARTQLALPTPVIAPLFSPRTARFLAAAAPAAPDRAPLWIAALSPAVAVGAGPAQPERITVAAEPEVPSLLDAIEELLAAQRQP